MCIGSVAFAITFTYAMLGRLAQLCTFHDWDLFTSFMWTPVYTIRHFHQFPIFDPWKGGGLPMLGNPQSRIVTPFFLLDLIFGAVVGIHLEIIAHIALAFSGGYVLARVLGVRPLAALAAAVTFGSTSWFYLHTAEGHLGFLAAAFLPWVATLFWLSIERYTWTASIVAGMFLALTFLEGAAYLIIWGGIMMVGLAIGFARVRTSIRPLLCAVVVAISSFGFSAVKLLPAIEMFRRYPIGSYGPESYALSQLRMFMFSRDQDLLRTGTGFGFWEYGAYVSIALAILALLGIFTSRRRTIPWLLVAIVFLMFFMGDTGPYSPWTLLREHTGMQALHLAPRCLIGVILSVSVLAALGAEMLCVRLGKPGVAIVSILLVVGMADSWLVSSSNLRHMFESPDTPLPWSSEFRQTNDLFSRYHMMSHIMANIGVIPCYEFTLITTTVHGFDEPGYRGEQHLAGAGMVALTRWTPNVVSYRVEASSPTELIVNRNYDRSWRIVEGNGKVISEGGLLAVRLPAGTQELSLAYRNGWLILGAGIGLLTIATSILVWMWERDQALRTRKLQ